MAINFPSPLSVCSFDGGIDRSETFSNQALGQASRLLNALSSGRMQDGFGGLGNSFNLLSGGSPFAPTRSPSMDSIGYGGGSDFDRGGFVARGSLPLSIRRDSDSSFEPKSIGGGGSKVLIDLF